MIHAAHPAPPLPATWPFQPRESSLPIICIENHKLPGLDGRWTLCTAGKFASSGHPIPMEGAFGRGGVFRVGEVVIRPYRRGGLLRHVNERIYLSQRRFATEHAVHQALWESGFPTIEPMGYAYRPCTFGVEGVLITRMAQGEPWPRRWDLGLERLPALLQAVSSLCSWGLWSPDLNATNVLLPPEEGVLLLDWDRARFVPGKDLWPRYRERLLRSLRKLDAPKETINLIESAPRP